MPNISAIKLSYIYTVSELEVRNLKRLEMIEKQNNFDITCLYLQEYKKEFAFLTKFHYFYHKKLTNLTFERRKKNWKFFWVFCQFTIVKLAQIQKNQYVLKTSKSCRFGIITIVLIERFLAILLRFSKKIRLKKKIFFKIFFFQIFVNPLFWS